MGPDGLLSRNRSGETINPDGLVELWRICGAVSDADVLDRVFTETLARLRPMFNADRASIWRPDETKERAWRRRLAVGATEDPGAQDGTLISRAVDGKGIETRDRADGPQAAAIALAHDGVVHGVLHLARHQAPLQLDATNATLLQALAARMGSVLTDVQTMSQARRRQRQAGEHLRKQAIELRRLLRARSGLIGNDPSMKAVLKSIERSSSANVPVLITGETGTGKEAAARLIHRLSRRRGPLVVVDCGAIPGSLLESELFGHEKGAFTGADAKKIGRFEEAEGGTIFLDEIGELPLELQPKLLRVLQESTVRPVGGTEEIHLDFRLVAATNRNLSAMVAQKAFREDLLFRLRVLEIGLPPLRTRGEDVVLLALNFVRQYCMETGRDFLSISPEAQALLFSHPWPGNVRELQNTIRRAVLLSPGPELTVADLGLTPPQKSRSRPAPETAAEAAPPAMPEGSLEDAVADWFWDVWTEHRDAPPQDMVRAYLLRGALRLANGGIRRAAPLLSLHPDTFGAQLDKYGHVAASRPVRRHRLADQLDAALAHAMEEPPKEAILDRVLAVLLSEMLVQTKGNKSEMARALGWGRQTLQRHLSRLDVTTSA